MPWLCEHVGYAEKDGLQEAAEDVLRWVQEQLLALESPVEYQLARSLARDRYQAITALISLDGQSAAKRTVLRIAKGATLTLCMGDAYRVGGIREHWKKAVETDAGTLSFSVRGCGAKIPDQARTSSDMWPGLCEDCRKAFRAQGRALKKRVRPRNLGRAATVYVSSGVIPVEQFAEYVAASTD